MRDLAAGAGVLFWGYLVVRWVNDWVVPAGLGVPDGQPFVSPQPFDRLGAGLRAVGLSKLDAVRYVDLLLLAAPFYLGLVLSASALMGHVERAVSIPGLGGRPVESVTLTPALHLWVPSIYGFPPGSWQPRESKCL